MSEGCILTFLDPDGYAAAFAGAGVNLTITGAGDFRAELTRLRLQHLEVYRCCESLPRISYISLSPERLFLSFPIGPHSPLFGGFSLRNGDIVFHSRGEHVHQRSTGGCQWGLISLSGEQLANDSKVLTGQPITPPRGSMVLRPARAEALRFQRLFRQACRLAETKGKLVRHPEVARAQEHDLLHTIIHCIATHEAHDRPRTRDRHATVMVRLEDALSKYIDEKLDMPTLCATVGVAERTLRMCCAEFLGVSPMRYVLLRRLNTVRAELQRADPSTSSVTQIARNHQFLELGRFAAAYRTTFGELPSATLQRGPRTQFAEGA